MRRRGDAIIEKPDRQMKHRGKLQLAQNVLSGVVAAEITLASIAIVHAGIILGLLFGGNPAGDGEFISMGLLLALSVFTIAIAWKCRQAQTRAWLLMYPLLVLKTFGFSGALAQYYFYTGAAWYLQFDSATDFKTNFDLGGQFVLNFDPPADLMRFGINIIALVVLLAASWARGQLRSATGR